MYNRREILHELEMQRHYDTNLARSTVPKYLFENNINTNREESWESDCRLGQMVPLIANWDIRLWNQDV